MNFEKMTEKLQKIFIDSVNICKDNQNPELSSEHLIKAFLDDIDIENILSKLKCDINPLNNCTDSFIDKLPRSNSNSEPSLNKYVFESYNKANNNSKEKGDKYLSALELFKEVLFNDSLFCKNLRKLIKFNKNELETAIENERGE